MQTRVAQERARGKLLRARELYLEAEALIADAAALLYAVPKTTRVPLLQELRRDPSVTEEVGRMIRARRWDQ